MDTKTEKKNWDVNEAPASVTYSITSKDGYNALFTIRDINGASLLDTMEIIEKVLHDKKYLPQVKQGFGAKKEVQYVEGKVCPLCKGRLIKAISKVGKEFHKCENGKFIGGVASGCKFVDWLNTPQPANPYTQTLVQAEEWGA